MLHRLSVFSTLIVGVSIGGVLLAILLGLASKLYTPTVQYRGVLAGIGALILYVGDLAAIGGNRLYPFGARRQTAKALMQRGHGDRFVGLVYGVDAGLAVTTYRVTSGIWVLLLFVALKVTGAYVILAYSAGFVIGLTLVTVWPVNEVAPRARAERVYRRVARLVTRRQLVQVAYSTVLLPVALLLFF